MRRLKMLFWIFREMKSRSTLLISLGVAAVSFIIGWIANQALHVEI
jgi:hypothetical protein